MGGSSLDVRKGKEGGDTAAAASAHFKVEHFQLSWPAPLQAPTTPPRRQVLWPCGGSCIWVSCARGGPCAARARRAPPAGRSPRSRRTTCNARRVMKSRGTANLMLCWQPPARPHSSPSHAAPCRISFTPNLHQHQHRNRWLHVRRAREPDPSRALSPYQEVACPVDQRRRSKCGVRGSGSPRGVWWLGVKKLRLGERRGDSAAECCVCARRGPRCVYASCVCYQWMFPRSALALLL